MFTAVQSPAGRGHVRTHRLLTNSNDQKESLHEIYLSLCLWLFAVEVHAGVVRNVIGDNSSKLAPVLFRWSQGFELNAQQTRCATDQSSEGPTNVFLKAYPEMRGA